MTEEQGTTVNLFYLLMGLGVQILKIRERKYRTHCEFALLVQDGNTHNCDLLSQVQQLQKHSFPVGLRLPPTMLINMFKNEYHTTETQTENP